jgi:hypothetical protein
MLLLLKFHRLPAFCKCNVGCSAYFFGVESGCFGGLDAGEPVFGLGGCEAGIPLVSFGLGPGLISRSLLMIIDLMLYKL